MEQFTYKKVYTEEGRRVLEMNILPEKYCNFDCIFCPIGRSYHKVDTPQDFGSVDEALADLARRLEEEKPELVFINSKGESFVHDQLGRIIAFIHEKGFPLRLLTNGYLLGNPACAALARQCEEVLGEIKTVTEEDFQKVQRPIANYTLAAYVAHMQEFRKTYEGTFIFEVTLLRGYNDDDTSVAALQEIIGAIRPDKLLILTMDDERFMKKLALSSDRYVDLCRRLQK